MSYATPWCGLRARLPAQSSGWQHKCGTLTYAVWFCACKDICSWRHLTLLQLKPTGSQLRIIFLDAAAYDYLDYKELMNQAHQIVTNSDNIVEEPAELQGY